MTISFVVVGVPVFVPQYLFPTGLVGIEVEVDEAGAFEGVADGVLDDDPQAANRKPVARREMANLMIGLQVTQKP